MKAFLAVIIILLAAAIATAQTPERDRAAGLALAQASKRPATIEPSAGASVQNPQLWYYNTRTGEWLRPVGQAAASELPAAGSDGGCASCASRRTPTSGGRLFIRRR